MEDALYFIRKLAFQCIYNDTYCKSLEVIGNSDKSWQDAAQAALEEAKKTVHGITGIESECHAVNSTLSISS
jgi:flavin-binding protein dodecin